MRTPSSFFPFEIFAITALSTTTGAILAFFAKPEFTISQLGMNTLPMILVRNELMLCLIALFSASWFIQDLVLFSNFFLQSYFTYSALSIYGLHLPVLATMMFAFIEGSLLVLLSLKTRKRSKPIIQYLPIFMVLMALSAIIEVIIL